MYVGNDIQDIDIGAVVTMELRWMGSRFIYWILTLMITLSCSLLPLFVNFWWSLLFLKCRKFAK